MASEALIPAISDSIFCPEKPPAIPCMVFSATPVIVNDITAVTRPTPSTLILPLFFLPLFSDLNALNLTQTTALQFHFSVLFGLIAADIGFFRPPTYHNSLKFEKNLVLIAFQP